ncbi:MAG TPA: serine hydrolase [Acidimicrobiales bacterium]|nr:serine hydrolase [Acidimicrobiales bacterium]
MWSWRRRAESGGWTRWRVVAVVVAALLAALLALSAAAAFRLSGPVPTAIFRAATLDTTVPGAPPPIAWPAAGQAAISVPAVGWRASSGPAATPAPIASVAKMMTAYVVLNDHPLGAADPGPAITMTQADVDEYRQGIAANRSEVAVAAGGTLTQRQALEALLIASANNIARALAVWDAGSVASFVDRMNATAEKLGMSHTKYTDPSGFDAATVSTAADQVLLAEAAMASPAFAAVVAQPATTLPLAGRIPNYNFQAGQDGVVGVKTGSTYAAGGCFVAAVRRSVGGVDVTAYAAVLGQRGPDLIAAGVNTGAALAKAAAAVPVRVTVVHQGERVGDLRTAWGRATAVEAQGDVSLLARPGDRVRVSLDTRPVRTPVAGGVVGRVTASAPSGATATTTAAAQQRVPPPSTWWRLVHG